MSHVSFRNLRGDQVQGALVRLSRQQVVFELYDPYAILRLSEIVEELSIRQGDRKIYHGRAVITGLRNTGLMLLVSASLMDPWSGLVGLAPGQTLRSVVREFVADWDVASKNLRPAFQVSVGNLRSYLQELNRWLTHWECESQKCTPTLSEDALFDVIKNVDQEISPRLMELYYQFEVSSQDLPENTVPYHRWFAQQELRPLMMLSPFLKRAVNKPLGYAGDYETVRMMLSEPLDGPTAFAKILNASALRHDLPAARHNRISMLHDVLNKETENALAGRSTKLKGGVVNVMCFGCGSGIEVQNFCESSPQAEKTHFHLIDFDFATLEYVQNHTLSNVRRCRPSARLDAEQESLYELVKQAVEKSQIDDPKYDMVYCPILFDYFRDTTCKFLIELFYSWVKPGGLVLLVNETPSRASAAIMSLVLDWNTELRTTQSMLNLAPHLGQQRTYCDATGVNVFLEVRK